MFVIVCSLHQQFPDAYPQVWAQAAAGQILITCDMGIRLFDSPVLAIVIAEIHAAHGYSAEIFQVTL